MSWEAEKADEVWAVDYPGKSSVYDFVGYGLRALSDNQALVSSLVPGAVRDLPTNQEISEVSFALQGEVFELAQELGWKSWKANGEIDKGRVADEFADILAFLGLLTLYVEKRVGLTPRDLADAYAKKSAENVARFTGKRGDAYGYWVGKDEDGESPVPETAT